MWKVTQQAGPRRRAMLLVAAAMAFAALFLFSPWISGDVDVFDLPDVVVHNVAHVVVYGVLTLLLAAAFGGRALRAGALTLVLSAAEELHQIPLPERTASVQDWLLNLVGVVLALLLLKAVTIRWRRAAAPVAAS